MLPGWSRSLQHFSRACLLRTIVVSLLNDFGSSCQRIIANPLPFGYHGYLDAAAVAAEELDKRNSISKLTVNLNKMFWSKPCSLALPPDSPLRIEEPKFEGLKQIIFKMLLFIVSRASPSGGGGNVVYKRVASQVDTAAIYDVFNLEKTFKTTFSLLVLHMWLVLRCLKEEGKEGVQFGQYVYEIHNHYVEMRVSRAGVGKDTYMIGQIFTRDPEARFIGTSFKELGSYAVWMKDLEKIFYGNIVAYDTTLLLEAKKDELSNVIWRNILSDGDEPKPTEEALHFVQAMSRYARRESICLSLTDKDAILSSNLLFTPQENPYPASATE